MKFARLARLFILLSLAQLQIAAPHDINAQAGHPTILNREISGPLLPPSVFYRGQVAPIQTRNSAGLKLPDGKLALFALVDTSGYASSVQQTYQAYLITEVPLQIAGHILPPGSYGFGFVPENRMLVMDLGGNEVLSTETVRDPSLARPNPLQLRPDADGDFRLYLGRIFVTFSPAAK